MIETLSPDNIKEILKPTTTPEMGFQSYELLDGDAGYRKAQETAFLNDDIRNPQFDYPKIDEAWLKNGINVLEDIANGSRMLPEPIVADAVYDTAGYRMAEMYWLRQTKRVNDIYNYEGTSERFYHEAHRYQELNEQLYGMPDAELTTDVYGEIFAQADAKDLHPAAQKIKDELLYGVDVAVAGETVRVHGVEAKVGDSRLPQNVNETLGTLREVLREDYADIFEMVNEYWDKVIEQREVPDGEEKGFNAQDIKILFEVLLATRDPEGTSGITIQDNPGSTQISWDTPTMSVQVGTERPVIDSKADMVGKLIHEFEKHAGSAIHGLQSELPVLGTGLYTEADEGEDADYLTFEEGFASMCEVAVDDSFEGWKALHISRYLALELAYDGADFRQAYETTWRACALMELKDGQDLSEAILKKVKRQAFIATKRIYRGTPTELSEGRPLMTFNKDVAYLKGKYKTLKYLESVGDDKSKIRRLFKGKFDPTNHRQNELADRFISVN